MFQHRRYKTGSNWAALRWKDILFKGVLYLRRLHILHTPLGGVMLHWITTADPQRDLHDHPVDFLALVLRGGYTEEYVPGNSFTVGRDGPILGVSTRQIRWVNWKRIPGVHRIVSVQPKTITLVFYGPSRHTWGFYTYKGWVPWRKYEHKGEQL